MSRFQALTSPKVIFEEGYEDLHQQHVDSADMEFGLRYDVNGHVFDPSYDDEDFHAWGGHDVPGITSTDQLASLDPYGEFDEDAYPEPDWYDPYDYDELYDYIPHSEQSPRTQPAEPVGKSLGELLREKMENM